MAARAGFQDLLLPSAVVGVVGVMVFPLPPMVLDFLLVCNIAFALVLIVAAVYISKPELFTSLPTILLLATLFRLGLNVSTTRQILGAGEAPEIIVAFGDFVVQGNMVVGAVVFLIITVVQFLVIAKGAERVAEVAARFTLDAMPGKQMAIDADVRSGIISLNDARERRLSLQRESKLYGSLDGAMKFVKGDAIAGLLITFINISAGLIVGTTQQGLSLSDAMAKYSLLTVGDGLVSQLPALLVAVSSGIVVTRVGNKKGDFIGRDMFRQLAQEPQAIGTAAAMLLALSFVPGLPTFSFIFFAILLAATSLIVSQQASLEIKRRDQNEFRPTIYSSLVVKLCPVFAKVMREEKVIAQEVRDMRTEIFESFGVLIPEIHFVVQESILSNSAVFCISGNQVRVFNAEPTANVGGGLSHRVVSELKQTLLQNLPELIDDTQTRQLLDLHHGSCEDLINAVVPGVISVTALTRVLRQLIAEGVAISEMSRILQAIAEHGSLIEKGALTSSLGIASGISSHLALRTLSEQPHSRLSELRDLYSMVRMALRRRILQSLATAENSIEVFVLHPALDYLLAETSSGNAPIEPNLAQNIVDNIRSLVTRCGKLERPIIVTTTAARFTLWSLLRHEIKGAHVLCLDELLPDMPLRVLAQIDLPGLDALLKEKNDDIDDVEPVFEESEEVPPSYIAFAAGEL